MKKSDTLIQENVLLAPLTYFKIGGPAQFYAEPKTREDLHELHLFLQKAKCSFFILGAGSNVLFDDRGFSGLVIRMTKLEANVREEPLEKPLNDAKLQNINLYCGAGALVIHILRHCMTHGIGGLEFLTGIPGSMGGVFAMNAGTRLGELSNVVQSVSIFDLETGCPRSLSETDLRHCYHYRGQTFLKSTEFILSGVLRAKREEPAAVQKRIQDLLVARKNSQPIDKPSCGSVFKNPPADKNSPSPLSAWQLVDAVGLRGYRIGQAEISAKHTNFILNLGGASAADVLQLIQEAQTRVHSQFGVMLEPEVRIVPYN